MSKSNGHSGDDLLPPEVEITEVPARSDRQLKGALVGIISTVIAGIILFMINTAGARTQTRAEALDNTRTDVTRLQEQVHTLDKKVDELALDMKEALRRLPPPK